MTENCKRKPKTVKLKNNGLKNKNYKNLKIDSKT